VALGRFDGAAALRLALLAGGFGLIGLLDDRREIAAGLRLTAEALVAGGVAALGARAGIGPGGTGGLLLLGWCLLLVGSANAFNMIDNSDGLAAGAGALSALGLAAATGVPAARAAALLVAAALAGFWLWNRPPARLYLGDLGTLALGALLGAAFWAALPAGGGPAAGPGGLTVGRLAGLGLIAGYLVCDPLYTLARRLWRRRAPWRGGTDHLAHDLARRAGGWLPALRLILAVQAFSVGSGVLWLARAPAGSWLPAALLPWAILCLAAARTGVDRPRGL
jgi:UDP-N-acetylmuramyl pentapeptide phosphotransferase/UDP-N-acetylglucosamine-1-phosphate transferase